MTSLPTKLFRYLEAYSRKYRYHGDTNQDKGAMRKGRLLFLMKYILRSSKNDFLP